MAKRCVKWSEVYSCFSCDYLGSDCDEDKDEEMKCPKCGTRGGDGFGFAENDPRYKDKIVQAVK